MRYDSPRALAPRRTGRVQREGFELHWEEYGSGEPAILLLPPWSLFHSQVWKMQIPFLARQARVITFDPPGNGLSDPADDPAVYTERAAAEDALAVMDALEVDSAVVAGASRSVQRALILAGEYPDRVRSLVLLSPMFIVSRRNLVWMLQVHPKVRRWLRWRGRPVSWAKLNTRYWRTDLDDFANWFVGRRMFSRPFSGRVAEEMIAWAHQSDMDSLVASVRGRWMDPRRSAQLDLARRVRCPVLVIQGDQDRVTPFADGKALAQATRGRLHRVHGGEHGVVARRPVEVNLAIRDFITHNAESADEEAATSAASEHPPHPTRTANGAKRVLWWCSPLGLGHVRRDIAIARALRAARPGTEISWLAEDPVRGVLEREGERVHPASEKMPSECAGFEAHAQGHRLHAMEAWRALNEVAVAEFMVFHDVVERERYDLWVGDEAWALDYHLHENPGLKRAAYAWVADFVGYVPVAQDGEAERAHGVEFNAQMLDHVEPRRVRDLSLFIGEPADIVDQRFGPQLPRMREWAESHFQFSGYVDGYEPAALPDLQRLRAEFGWGDRDTIVLVAVGGSGVGRALLERAVGALGAIRQRLERVRMVAVAGPRIDPHAIPPQPDLEVHGYVHDLHRMIAACDVALVQGGLTTCMELVVAGRPFVYVPLEEHFEQQVHVPHRLDRYGAGRRMSFEQATPEALAEALVDAIGHPPSPLESHDGSAERAADALLQLL